jgi:hypothetical protein
MTAGGFVAGGYTLVLPPGWVRIPVNGSHTDHTIDEAITAALPADLPRDEAAKVRITVKGRLLAAAAEARDVGGLDLYLPLGRMHGLAIPASFVVSELPVQPGREADEAMREFATDPDAAPATVDGDPAIRLDAVLEPDTLMTEIDAPTRRITYLVPVPGMPRWLAVTFSTIRDGGSEDGSSSFSQILVDLFDAIMTTFRWAEPVVP